MSTCAIMLCRDEADIVAATVRHTLWHVDEMIVGDHRSVDGTTEILEQLPVTTLRIEARGFWEDQYRAELAMIALARGHEWVLVVDADDIWTTDDGGRIADYLAGLPDTVVNAPSFNHRPTCLDFTMVENPVQRIMWREERWDAHKVAARLRPNLRLHNHGAWYGNEFGEPTASGLHVRHFTVRTADQLLRKVRNSQESFSVDAGMPETYDDALVQWVGMTDDDIRHAFATRFWVTDPGSNPDLILDPAPWKGAP